MDSHWFVYDLREEIFTQICTLVLAEVAPGKNLVSLTAHHPPEEETVYSIYVHVFEEGYGDREEFFRIDPFEDRLWWEGAQFDITFEGGEFRIAPVGVPA